MKKTINEKADLIIHYYKQICELMEVDPSNSSVTLMIHGVKHIVSLDDNKWNKEAHMNGHEVYPIAECLEGNITLFGNERFPLEKEPIGRSIEEERELNEM